MRDSRTWGAGYRLLLVDDQEEALKIAGGRFRLLRSEAKNGREHFVAWYRSHAGAWLTKRIGVWSQRMGLEPASIRVQDLGFRWGSCGDNGAVNFHWASILLPPSIVDYVIVHELAHLSVRAHGPEFWQLVERAMPDYVHRKGWLATNGGSFASLN